MKGSELEEREKERELEREEERERKDERCPILTTFNLTAGCRASPMRAVIGGLVQLRSRSLLQQ